MEITAEEAAARLNNPDNFLNRPKYEPLHKGTRGGGSASTDNKGREIPPLIRTLIGITAHNDTIGSTAEAFGVSNSTVAAAKKGNVGINRHDPELKKSIDAVVDEGKKTVREAALDRLAGMFNSVITDDTLSSLKPREAVSAAKDIATIVEKVSPKQANGNVAVFISTTRVKDESEFGDIIEIEHKPVESKMRG